MRERVRERKRERFSVRCHSVPGNETDLIPTNYGIILNSIKMGRIQIFIHAQNTHT